MSAVVLFGAGVYAKKYKSLLEYMGLTFDYFTDNDQNKWGTSLFGREVLAPARLKEMDCHIIISCTHGEEIRQQLREMGMISKNLEINDLYEAYLQSLETNEGKKTIMQKDRVTLLFDMYEGIGWGGTEMWASDTALLMKEAGHKVMLFGSDQQEKLGPNKEQLTLRFSDCNTIEKMVEKIEDNLPCRIINNFAGCVLLAAVMVKMKYPALIQIQSVIHSDHVPLIDAHVMFDQWVDGYFCVSRNILERMESEYEIPRKKLFAREPYIPCEEGFEKSYAGQEAPLRIGYAARLVRQAKRVDLFPELIKQLEQQNVHYRLEIAGEGECKAELEAFVISHKLGKKVILPGRIAREEMPEFWKRQDIFISLSEHEGASLSMLEAMSCGAVPVVTLVSGVAEYIEHKVNGLICKVGDLQGLAEAVAWIDKNRESLPRYGEYCSEQIRRRCSQKEYIAYLEQFLDLKRG